MRQTADEEVRGGAAAADPSVPASAKRVVLVDARALYAEAWRAVLACRYGPAVSFEHYDDPKEALVVLGPDVNLLLFDMDLPSIDGRRFADLAKERGVACRRIVVLSDRPADELHALFSKDACLAVINKTEPQQQSAFLMILDSIVKRH